MLKIKFKVIYIRIFILILFQNAIFDFSNNLIENNTFKKSIVK